MIVYLVEVLQANGKSYPKRRWLKADEGHAIMLDDAGKNKTRVDAEYEARLAVQYGAIRDLDRLRIVRARLDVVLLDEEGAK